MKIKKFNEKINEKFYIFIDKDESAFYDNSTYIFYDIKDLNNFMANKIYKIFTEHCEDEEILEESLITLDDCENAEEMIEFLNETLNSGDILGDYTTRLYYETTTLDKNIELEDWIKLRRNSKNYNL